MLDERTVVRRAGVRHDGGVATATRNQSTNRGAVRGFVAGRPPTLRQAVLFVVACAALVLALRLWLKWVGPMPGDQWVRRHHDSVWLQPTPVVDLGTFFSVIGTPVVAILTVVVGLIYAVRAEGARGGLFLLLAASGTIANAALKELSGPTPLMVALGAPAGLNFPSGHTVYAVATFGALAFLARRARRFDVAVPLVGLLLLMGPFRVIATAHFVSDVVAGYLVGLAWLVLCAALVLSPSPRKR